MGTSIPVVLTGNIKGNFSSFIPKTVQERIQNLPDYFEKYENTIFEVSIKIDGSSCTLYYNNGEFGVCSRNYELLETDNNAYWEISRKYNIREKLTAYNKKYCGTG